MMLNVSDPDAALIRLRQWADAGATPDDPARERLCRALLAGANAVGASPPLDETPFLSAILPVYNEQENLPALLERLVPVLESLGTYEVIFVNDGSHDSSADIVRQAHAANPRIKLLDLSRNFGHQAALSAGLHYARGQVITLLDADLQDPPESLPMLLEKWREGYKVVYAVREKRKEALWKRGAYHLFYRLLQSVSSIPIPLDSGDFCLMDRRVVDEILLLPEHNRFLRGLRSWVGFKQIGVRYERAARHAGEPKYTLAKLIKLAVDGLVSFTTAPLRLATHTGVWVAAVGALYLIYILIGRGFGLASPPGWTSLAAVVLLIGGIQLVVLGVQGEYIGRIYEEAKGRPEYIVREAHGTERTRKERQH